MCSGTGTTCTDRFTVTFHSWRQFWHCTVTIVRPFGNADTTIGFVSLLSHCGQGGAVVQGT